MVLNRDLNFRESEPKLWAKHLQKQKRKNHAKISVLVHFSIFHFVFNFWNIPGFCVSWFRHGKVKYCELGAGNSVIGKLRLSGFQRLLNQLLTPNIWPLNDGFKSGPEISGLTMNLTVNWRWIGRGHRQRMVTVVLTVNLTVNWRCQCRFGV